MGLLEWVGAIVAFGIVGSLALFGDKLYANETDNKESDGDFDKAIDLRKLDVEEIPVLNYPSFEHEYLMNHKRCVEAVRANKFYDATIYLNNCIEACPKKVGNCYEQRTCLMCEDIIKEFGIKLL